VNHFTSISAPGVNDIDPRSLIWPGENKDKALLNKGVDELAVWVHRLGASDLHLQAREPAKVNLHGRLFPVMTRPVMEREIDNATVHLYGAGANAWLLDGNDFTVGHTVKVMAQDDGRFVIGGHRSLSGGTDERYRFRWQGAGVKIYGANSCQLTARIVEQVPPTLSDLGLEPGIIQYHKPPDGLVLITGGTSQGKTRVVAGITRGYLEDPQFHGKILEFANPYEHEFGDLSGPTSMYAVSDIPSNYKTGAMGMRGALHRAPRVIIAPEMRDAVSAHFALEAGQTGHTVYATVHTNTVAETMQRILFMFPLNEREERAVALLQSLRLIISCKLVASLDGRRIQLREFLPFTSVIRRQLLAKPYAEWPFLSEQMVKSTGQTFVMAAEAAIDEGKISEEVALPFLEEH
jgi:defect-in-organelle-trafficking protein DotB